jgi:hypothetical protein
MPNAGKFSCKSIFFLKPTNALVAVLLITVVHALQQTDDLLTEQGRTLSYYAYLFRMKRIRSSQQISG